MGCSKSKPMPFPGPFESLNDDTLGLILKFVGNKSYKPFGGLNKQCREVYLASGMTKETFLFGYGPLSAIKDRFKRRGQLNQAEVFYEIVVGYGIVYYNRSDVLEWALKEQTEDLLHNICNVAAKEGRIDVLDEVWNNIDYEGKKRATFDYLFVGAAESGKLDVLKWLVTKGLVIDKDWCAFEAACRGQLHIIEWLQEKRGLELYGRLYECAIRGNHLHVMKWLREQEVPWRVFTFENAARVGNLEVLQWLHDEGCTWPDPIDYGVDRLKPEVIDWCRSNGYGDRILSRR